MTMAVCDKQKAEEKRGTKKEKKKKENFTGSNLF